MTLEPTRRLLRATAHPPLRGVASQLAFFPAGAATPKPQPWLRSLPKLRLLGLPWPATRTATHGLLTLPSLR